MATGRPTAAGVVAAVGVGGGGGGGGGDGGGSAGGGGGWSKWQIALVIAAPFAVGAAGLWFYRKRLAAAKTKRLNDDAKTTEENAQTDPTDGGNETQVKDPLQLAQSAKNKGNKYFKAGRFDKSIECYTEAINVCPPENRDDIATFYQNRAAAYEQLKSYGNVIDDCTKALEYNNRYVKALFRRAKAEEVQIELTKCLEDITAVCILENFSNQNSLLMADRVLKDLGHSRAREKFQTREPKDPSAQFIRNYFYSFANDPIMNSLQEDETRPETKDVLHDHHEGDEKEKVEEMEKESKYSKSSYRRALQQLRKHDYSGDIIRLCTSELDGDQPSFIAESLLLRATFYLLRGESNKALDDFEKLLSMNGVDKRIRSNALIKRASLKMQSGQQVEAFKDFNLAVAQDPENSDVFHHKGQIHLLIERYDEAVKDFEKSVTLSPGFAVAHAQKCYADYRLAMSMGIESAVESAARSFETTISKFPDCAEGYALYGQVLIDMKNFDKADENFKKAIQIEPDNGSIYVHRGLLRLQWKQDIDEAARLIEKAMEVDSKCEFAYETLGTIEIQRGGLDKAVELFDKAIDLSRSEAEMAHLYSLLDAATAQAKVAQRLGIQLPSMM